MNSEYMIDTDENKAFMNQLTEELLSFGHKFPSPTGSSYYLGDDYAMFLQYLDEKVLDHVNGSWFHQLDANNHVIGTVWPGKSDIYHALQATLIPYCDVSLSVAVAVSKIGCKKRYHLLQEKPSFI